MASVSLAVMAGYHLVNRARSVPSRVRVRVCRSRWAPCLDPCICCFLAKRLPTTRLTVDSTKAVEIASPVLSGDITRGSIRILGARPLFEDPLGDFPLSCGLQDAMAQQI